MVALLFCPIKGNANYPPLSVSLLSAYLKENSIPSTVIDLNKSFYIENANLAAIYSNYFGYPSILSGFTDNENEIKNVDTIYNFSLLLSILYGNDKVPVVYSDEEKELIRQIEQEIDFKADQIINSNYKYIGFSTYISNIAYSCILAKKLKEKNASISIFFGGSSTSYMPIREFLLEMGLADYVIVGEGENAIIKLIKDLESGAQLTYNTIFSENIAPPKLQNNETIVPIISDLDVLPFPDFSDLNLTNYSPKNKDFTILPIYSSRGCINQCVYCSETQYWQRFRQRSITRVIDEIKHGISKYNAKCFFFHDSLINGNVKWLEDFCDQLIKEELNINWLSFASVQNLNLHILQKMQKSGCISLTYGIEHISEKVLRDMNKMSSLGKAKEVLETTIKLGIMPIANIIYGLLGENDEDFANLLYFTSLPQFKGRVYFTYRSFEIRVGSVISNKIIENMENVKIRKSDFSNFNEKQKEIFSKIDIYWLPDSEYVKKLMLKLNVINKFINEQETTLSIKQSTIKNYDTIPVLRSIITLDKKPIFAHHDTSIDSIMYGLSHVQKEIVLGASNGFSLSEISDGMYEKVVALNPSGISGFNAVNETIKSSVIENAILLTQMNILKWKK